MAADLLGIAFIPYYNHLMNLLKTNPELRKTAKGQGKYFFYFTVHQPVYIAVTKEVLEISEIHFFF